MGKKAVEEKVTTKIIVTSSSLGSLTRLDAFLADYLKSLANFSNISRSLVEKWIIAGLVKVNKQTVKRPSYKVLLGQEIEIEAELTEPTHLEADPTISLNIVFEDEEILVINKPAGLVTHPGAGNRHKTLVNGLVSYLGNNLPKISGEFRPGIVHRLDKDTSGLMVIAKTEHSYYHLIKQFKPPRRIKRNYLALTLKLPQSNSSVISLPIGRHPTHRTKMAVVDTGRPSVTNWHLKKTYQLSDSFCLYLLELELETGRTHQIRVHLHAQGASIIGDQVYRLDPGQIPPNFKNLIKAPHQLLHAYCLSLEHPRTQEVLSFEAPMPEAFLEFLKGVSPL